MVVKGIIKSIDFNGNTCIVRIPLLENSINNNEVVMPAIISTVPGIYNGYKEGDVVIVGFENNEIDRPIVFGKLYLGTEAENNDPRGAINCNTIKSTAPISIPIDTKLTLNNDGLDNTTVGVDGDLTSFKSIADIAKQIKKQETEIGSISVKIIDDGENIGARVTKVEKENIIQGSEIIQNAEHITAEVSRAKGVEGSLSGRIDVTESAIENSVVHKEKSGEVNGLSWHLDTDNWTLEKIKTSTKTEILKANEDGLTVNGIINAEKGGTIGGFDIDDSSIHTTNKTAYNDTNVGVYLGTDGIGLGEGTFYVSNAGELHSESGTIGGFNINDSSLYNGMTSFTDTSHDGIYIGTDGIALGKGKFKISKEGTITISGYATETYAEDVASDAEQAAKDWVGEQGYQDSEGVETVITNTGVTAQNLKVKFANITGALVVTDGTNEIFKADAANNIANLGNFKIVNDGLAFIQNDTELISVKSDKLKYGSNFEVTNAGVLTAKAGTIGGFDFDGNKLYSADDQDNVLVEISKNSMRYGDNFIVDSEGNLSVVNASILTDSIILNGDEVTIANTGTSTTTITNCYISNFTHITDISKSFNINITVSPALSAPAEIIVSVGLVYPDRIVQNAASYKIKLAANSTSQTFSRTIMGYTSIGAIVSSYPKKATGFTTKGPFTAAGLTPVMWRYNPAHIMKMGYDSLTNDQTSVVVTKTLSTGLSGIDMAVATYRSTGHSNYGNRSIHLDWNYNSGNITATWNVHDEYTKTIYILYIGH